MAEDFKVFEIDDSFDPLEDLHIDVEEEEDEEEASDYQLPEFSPEEEVALVEPAQEASVEERMEQLFKGMPGQKMRLLKAVDLCRERISLDDLKTALSAEFPNDKSVYSPARIAELLERAGALSAELEEIEQDTESDQASDAPALASSEAAAAAFAEGKEAHAEANEAASAEAAASEAATENAEAAAGAEAAASEADEALVRAEEEVEEAYLVVAPPAITYYTATEDGLAMVDAHMGASPIVEAINEQDGKYRHVYKAVLQAAAAVGGTTAKQLDAVLEGDPVLEEPRRFSTYFLRKLEEVDALRWLDVWVITDAGRSVLDAEFANAEGE